MFMNDYESFLKINKHQQMLLKDVKRLLEATKLH